MSARIITLCVLIIAALGIFGTNTLIKTIHTQNVQISGIKADIKQAEIAKNNLTKIKSTIASRESDIKLMEIALPADASIPEVLVMLESIYQAEGFTPSSVSLSTSQENTAEVPTAISGQSSYQQLFNIFAKITSNIRPVQIKNFTASGTEDDRISSSFTLTFPFATASSESTLPSSTPSQSASTTTEGVTNE